jgi:hypothetical protein
MSSSTPEDLSVAFRSFPRRLRDAVQAETPQEAIDAASAAVNAAVAGAANLVGSRADAAAVADGIAARHWESWSDEELRELQGYANQAARAIRQLEDAVAEEDAR